MRTFGLKILTPAGEAFSGEVGGVYLRTTDGEVGILAGHTDYLAGVVACTVKMIDSAEKEQYAFCGGGFFSMTAGEATLMADELVFAGDLDKEAIAQEVEEISSRLSGALDPETAQFLKTRLIRAKVKQKVLAADEK